MNLQTFSAPTMAEALLQVKRTLGHDAVILHTRTVQRRQWMGLRRQEVIEVTAGPSAMHTPRRRPSDIVRSNETRNDPRGNDVRGNDSRSSESRSSDSRSGDSRSGDSRSGDSRSGDSRQGDSRSGDSRSDSRGGDDRRSDARRDDRHQEMEDDRDQRAVASRPLSAGRPVSPVAAAYARTSNLTAPAKPANGAPSGQSAAIAANRGVMNSPEMTQVLMKLVTEEVGGMRKEFRDAIDQIRRAPSINGPVAGASIGNELAPYFERLVDAGVQPTLAEDILKSARLQVSTSHVGNDAFVREKIAEQIDRLLPCAGPIMSSKPEGAGPHIVALIGPTGVGKTTTIAKLAANLQLQQGKRVGLLTIDTFRIAAVDQLRRYADIIGSPLKVVGSADDMVAAIESMSDMDYILIDTAGRSPTDSMKLSELRSLIDAANPDEVHLVLSATSDTRCMDLIVTNFAKVRCDRLLFTKIDEAFGVGGIVNISKKVGKPLSYITTGQDVPYDIEVAHGRDLAKLVLGATPKSVELKPEQAPVIIPANSGMSRPVTGSSRMSLAGQGGVK